MCAQSLQLCLTLCNTMDCSPPGFSVRGTLQARILEWVAMPSSRGSSWSRDWTCVSCFLHCRWILYHWATREAHRWNEIESEVAQSCPTLCNLVDCSLPGSSVHGILQARILEWVAISSSRGSSQPRDWTLISCVTGRCFNLWATCESLYCTLVTYNIILQLYFNLKKKEFFSGKSFFFPSNFSIGSISQLCFFPLPFIFVPCHTLLPLP